MMIVLLRLFHAILLNIFATRHIACSFAYFGCNLGSNPFISGNATLKTMPSWVKQSLTALSMRCYTYFLDKPRRKRCIVPLCQFFRVHSVAHIHRCQPTDRLFYTHFVHSITDIVYTVGVSWKFNFIPQMARNNIKFEHAWIQIKLIHRKTPTVLSLKKVKN